MDLLTIQDGQVMMSNDTYNKFIAKYDLAVPQINGKNIFITNKGRLIYINPKTLDITKTGTLIIIDEKLSHFHCYDSREIKDDGNDDPKPIIYKHLDYLLMRRENIEFLSLDDKKFIHFVPLQYDKTFIQLIMIKDNKIIHQEMIETKDNNEPKQIRYRLPCGTFDSLFMSKENYVKRAVYHNGVRVFLYRV